MKHLSQLSFFLSLPLLIISAPAPIVPRQFGGSTSTENGLTSGGCKNLTVIFARGTSEPGNVGAVAGPPMFAALRAALGDSQVAVQGVEYSASFAGAYSGGDAAGSATMLDLVNTASQKCPGSKLVLSGYSQGAQLVHNVARKLSTNVSSQIAAVVVFGDPDILQPIGAILSAKVKSICHPGDPVCTGTGSIAAHLTYGQDAQSAASFVVERTGLDRIA